MRNSDSVVHDKSQRGDISSQSEGQVKHHSTLHNRVLHHGLYSTRLHFFSTQRTTIQSRDTPTRQWQVCWCVCVCQMLCGTCASSPACCCFLFTESIWSRFAPILAAAFCAHSKRAAQTVSTKTFRSGWADTKNCEQIWSLLTWSEREWLFLHIVFKILFLICLLSF